MALLIDMNNQQLRVSTMPKKKAKKEAKTAKSAAKEAKSTAKVAPKKATKPVAKAAPKKTAAKPAAKKAPAKASAKPAAKVAPKKAPVKAAAKPAAKATPKKAVAKPTTKTAPKKATAKPAAKKATVAPAKAPTKATATPANKTKKSTGDSPLQIRGVSPYTAKKGEDYMSRAQLAHFTNILNKWKQELMEEVDRTVHHMQDEAANYPDVSDRASQEEEFSLELRARDRERKLIKKINETLESIEKNDYGYCDSCGVEIGVRRLEARPTATKCIDCKTLDEIKEKQIKG